MLAVERSGLLEAGPDERFDRLVRHTQELFGVTAASIALITQDQQVLKSFVGPLSRSVDRRHALCNVTIQNEDLLIVPDTLEDPRFSTTPLVLGEPHIRFYAGCALRGPAGWFIGTLCIIDQAPRIFTTGEWRMLRALAIQAELELNDSWNREASHHYRRHTPQPPSESEKQRGGITDTASHEKHHGWHLWGS